MGGVGRFFEGTPEEMYSNFQVIASLPNDTHVFPGHEYAKSNLSWASQVDFSNAKMKGKLADIKNQQMEMVIPSTVGEEKEINIFMRCDQKEIRERLGTQTGGDTMRVLREMKNFGKVLI